MNFRQISFRMFKSNIRQYYLYIACGSFSTMIFFLFSTIMTNNDFNDSSKIDSMISSNLYAPSLVLAIFSFVFIVYAHNSFIKFRKKDYALFMVIGMTNSNVKKIMVFENILIVIASILSGLLLGTIFSKGFYFIVGKIIGNIDLSINLKSYIYTMIFFVGINMLLILKSYILLTHYKIIELLKNGKLADKNVTGNRIFAVLGVVLIISSIIIPILHNKITGFVLINIATILIGIYLVIANLDWFIMKILKLGKNRYINNLLFVSNLKYKIGSCKNIIFSITLLVVTIVFFISFALTATEVINNNAISYNPYDIAYCNLYGKNGISEELLNKVIKSNDVQLTSIKKLEFIEKNKMTIISNKILNDTVGCNLKVEKGKYISLFQTDINDGYNHHDVEIKNYDINGKTYYSQEKLVKILFNTSPVIRYNYCLIVNNDDYNNIKSRVKVNNDDIGTINLMNFSDWTKTEKITSELNKQLEMYNKNTREFFGKSADKYNFQTRSKIDDYILANRSSTFILFLFCFIFILFFVASNLMIHFKILTEFEGEKIKYKKLNKMGITEKELSNTILKELRIIFLLPCVFGIAIGMYCVCLKFLSADINTNYGIKYSIIAGVIYIMLEFIVYIVYNKQYINKILK
ncbi:ABC transporter permease [Clostridium estertheticum]|uniref:FtsX-like permease family protein n=1 Tax=Clostridium estertheticum TaxID=238834 RepID=UPI001C0C90C7|nr:ABC transporter permease [Clostridium estertheticum]MBU3201628.1 ABC transporter permease [Clostridium estertheticum]WAG67872.1 ABC transporter permease [Clostridium estertheticum]